MLSPASLGSIVADNAVFVRPINPLSSALLLFSAPFFQISSNSPATGIRSSKAVTNPTTNGLNLLNDNAVCPKASVTDEIVPDQEFFPLSICDPTPPILKFPAPLLASEVVVLGLYFSPTFSSYLVKVSAKSFSALKTASIEDLILPQPALDCCFFASSNAAVACSTSRVIPLCCTSFPSVLICFVDSLICFIASLNADTKPCTAEFIDSAPNFAASDI